MHRLLFSTVQPAETAGPLLPRHMHEGVDTTFVTFACGRDVHYAKALLGSINHFYPDNRIVVVTESDIFERDIRQMSRFPNTRVYRVPDLMLEHKLHLTGLLAKFNVLFLPGVARALVADADSVLIAPVMEEINPHKLFTALHGRKIDPSDKVERESFERWAVDVPTVRKLHPAFGEHGLYYVQGSHFYVNVSRFPYDIFYGMLKLMGCDHKTLTPLRAGDQGFWNYLLNSGRVPEADFELKPATIQVGQTPRVASCEDMEWVQRRVKKEWSFIHYVGFSRRYRRRDHDYAQVLQWATRRYYQIIGPSAYLHDELQRFMQSGMRAGRRRIRQLMRSEVVAR